MNKVNKVLKILKKSSRRRKRWREELRVEEEGESRELCDLGGLCRLHLCTGGKETGMLLLARRYRAFLISIAYVTGSFLQPATAVVLFKG